MKQTLNKKTSKSSIVFVTPKKIGSVKKQKPKSVETPSKQSKKKLTIVKVKRIGIGG